MSVVQSRPAESVGAAGGLAGIVAGLVSGQWQVAVAALSGVLPAVVTWIVTNGGVRGIVGSLWRGRS